MAKNVKYTFLMTQFCRQKTVSRRRAVKYWALTFDTNLMVQFSVEKILEELVLYNLTKRIRSWCVYKLHSVNNSFYCK